MPAKTNRTGFRAVRETTAGATPPPTSGWFDVEINQPASVGASITTTERNPINENRARSKGVITDLDSKFDWQQDLTMEAFEEFLEAALFSTYNHPGTTGVAFFRPTAAVDGGTGVDSFTVGADGDLVANELIVTRGFTNDENNGLFVVASGSTTTSVKVATGTLVAEAGPPSNAILEVCGVQGATSDIEIDGNGDIISSTLDFTTLGLKKGQMIKVGGSTAATQFDTAAYNGYARIAETPTANLIELDKRSWTVGSADDGDGQTIQLIYGRFIHDVAVTDALFLDRTYAGEVAFDAALLPGPAAHYMYPLGNKLNKMTLEFPLADKAGMNMEFIGTDTEDPTTSRHTGPSTSREPLKTEVVNTSSGIVRERVAELDEDGMLTDITNLSLVINQNVSPQKVHGTLGASSMNEGNLHIDVSITALFTDATILAHVRANETLALDAIYKTPNEGGFGVDLPAVTVGDDQLGFSENEPVTLDSTTKAFKDGDLGYQCSFSLFPYLP
jgi:hypothetical protein